MENVRLQLGRSVSAPAGSTILEAARLANITIPTLCYMKEINEIGALPYLRGGSQGSKDVGHGLCVSHQ